MFDPGTYVVYQDLMYSLPTYRGADMSGRIHMQRGDPILSFNINAIDSYVARIYLLHDGQTEEHRCMAPSDVPSDISCFLPVKLMLSHGSVVDSKLVSQFLLSIIFHFIHSISIVIPHLNRTGSSQI